jgi:hypothetical protein
MALYLILAGILVIAYALWKPAPLPAAAPLPKPAAGKNK